MIPGVTNSPLCTKKKILHITLLHIWSKQKKGQNIAATHTQKKLVLEIAGVFHMHTYNLTKI